MGTDGPGPNRYNVNIDAILPKRPSFTMGAGRESSASRKARKERPASAPSDRSPQTENEKAPLQNPIAGPKRLDSAFNFTKAASPKYSIGAKLEMEIGGSVPSWVKSIPGPAKYKYDADVFRTRSPKFTIGTKLPSESDLRS